MGGTAEVKLWWDEFGRMRDLDGKIAAVRRVCALNREEEFYKELDIGSAILDCIQEDFIRKRDREGYCKFLESLRRDFPKVFNLDSGYPAGFLIRWYAFTSQAERLAEIINHLVEFPREEPDILIDLMDALILIDSAKSRRNIYLYESLTGNSGAIPTWASASTSVAHSIRRLLASRPIIKSTY